jgi:hypothetical protein
VKLGDWYPAALKAEVQRISIQARSKVPGRRHPLGLIRANLHPDGAGLCRMLDTEFREVVIFQALR